MGGREIRWGGVGWSRVDWKSRGFMQGSPAQSKNTKNLNNEN